jgi:hypothetical protein
MEVAQFGPRELRVVKDGGWSLPVHCDPYTSDARTITHWSVKPAVQLLAAPFFELSKRFSPINMGSSTTYWVITNEQLESMTSRVTGCMPKDYLVWESKEPGKETLGLEIVTDSEKDDEFLKYFCKQASIDLPLGRYVWKAAKEGLRHWLINCQKPVDFELFTLYPLPYRANWKEIQLAKHLCCYSAFNFKRSTWTKRLTEIGFIQNLGSADLVSMNNNKTFNWTLEIVPSQLWHDSVKEGEEKRLALKGPTKYANYYESSLAKRFDDILTTFAAWIRQIAYPVASLRESPHNGCNILEPISKKRGVSPNRFRPSVTPFQIGKGGIGLVKGQLGEPRRVSKKIKQMLNMSTVSPSARDVRQLKRLSNLGGGTSGVLLPYENESKAGGGGLLVEGERTEQ